MNQRFAIIRPGAGPLGAEKLKRAFHGLPGLAPYDAGKVCSDDSVVLCRNFSPEQATALHANLKAQGVEVELVDESEFPELPPPKIIRRLEIKPEALFVVDLVKGMAPIAWDQVSLIAAGSVRLTKVTRKFAEGDESKTVQIRLPIPIHLAGIPIPLDIPIELDTTESKPGLVTKESTDWFLRLEILLAGGSNRYTIEAENFRFGPLGEGVTRDLSGNFCLLVRKLAANATKARLNRGGAAIVAEPCEFVYYPRKNVFHDEIAWLLWQGRQPQRT